MTANRSSAQPRPIPGWRIFVCLIGAPGAWIAQMLGSEVLTGNGCGQSDLIGRHLSLCLWLLSSASLMIGIAATWLSLTDWRRTRDEAQGDAHHALNVGEGRLRFFVLIGFFISLIFIVAILLTASALLMVAPCD